jgi:C4-dicarboxylate-specific signal transduction histidine kinase
MDIGTHTVALSVRDYGCGISQEHLRSFVERNEGNDVRFGACAKRARELGGLLSVKRAEDGGTVRIGGGSDCVARFPGRRKREPISRDSVS